MNLSGRTALALSIAGLLSCASPYTRHPLPSSEPIVQRPAIDVWEIEWDGASESAPASVYLGDAPDRIDRTQPVAELRGGAARVIGLDPAVRPYFEIEADDGSRRVVAERLLPLAGTENFRDLGGYPAADGRRTRWGMLYRSDDLSELSREDLRYLSRLGVKLVCDFRSPGERAKSPSRLPAEAPAVAHLAIENESFDPVEIEDRILSRDVEDADFETLLIEGNRAFATRFAHQYKTMFDRLEDSANLPALVHCTQGKDRTGFAAAIVLLALGVSEETVMQDYLLTNVYTASEVERRLLYLRLWLFSSDDAENLRPLLQVRREYLQAALDIIHEDYGSIDAYLTSALDLDAQDRQRLQSMLLD
jgi:protein-tyrosine phosphatase